MAQLYIDENLVEAHVGGVVSIMGSEARHAVTVSRIAVGHTVSVGNGAGLVVMGPVVAASSTEMTIRVDRLSETDARSPNVILIQALAKGDRDERAVQAATELGVDAIIPWAASRSVSRWEGAKAVKGRERWAAIAREASKQSLRPWIPEVFDLMTTPALCRVAERARMIILDPAADLPVSELEFDDRDLALVVGPEGGIAPKEFDALQSVGAIGVRLGDEVLRTSTAGPAAVAAVSLLLGRW